MLQGEIVTQLKDVSPTFRAGHSGIDEQICSFLLQKQFYIHT